VEEVEVEVEVEVEDEPSICELTSVVRWVPSITRVRAAKIVDHPKT
jgi:hypothetical protein